MNDHQIITGLIAEAVQMRPEHPLARTMTLEALALASAAELPILVQEALGVISRIDHDNNCRWCLGHPGAAIPIGSFWCTH